MDPTSASNRTVSLLSQYLNSRFAGAQPDPALDSLYQLVAGRLGASQSGQQALQAFSAAHHDPGVQARLAAAIAQEASLDWNFLSALTQATGDQPGTHTMTAPVAQPQPWTSPGPTAPAPAAAWPPGPPAGQPYPGAPGRSKLTPGWIVAIVAVAAVVLIAVVSTVVVIATQGGPYDEVAGSWRPDPATITEEEAGALVLRITDDGEWSLEGFTLLGAFSCAGELARGQGSTYTMQTDEGLCTTGSLWLEGDVLVMSGEGEEIRFVRDE
jgi:hypothetical protein